MHHEKYDLSKLNQIIQNTSESFRNTLNTVKSRFTKKQDLLCKRYLTENPETENSSKLKTKTVVLKILAISSTLFLREKTLEILTYVGNAE